jgi:dTDP-4-amino-4,6-dideoxygalactose transaminase
MTTERIFLSPPHIGTDELKLVQEAFASNYIAPLGEMVDNFEKEFSEYTGIRHSVAVSSGTAAMHMVLRCLGVGPGDEVFASTFTFIGSVSPITFLGARPVFIDADEKSWNMDPVLLEKELKHCSLLGKLPKAVVPTDLYGQCIDMPQILAICDKYNIPVICDSAESLGAQWLTSEDDAKKAEKKHAGKGAYAVIFSFNGNKIITTSGGGMVASDNQELTEKIQFLSTQAKEPLPHYEHKTIGYNYRMSNILAAIGRGQLRVLNDRVSRKKSIFSYYQQHLKDLKGITFMPEPQYSIGTRWLTCIRVNPTLFGANSEEIRIALGKNNIEARPVWKPMHMQPVFGEKQLTSEESSNEVNTYETRKIKGEVSEKIFNEGLCLPSGTAMSSSGLDRIIATIRRCQ